MVGEACNVAEASWSLFVLIGLAKETGVDRLLCCCSWKCVSAKLRSGGSNGSCGEGNSFCTGRKFIYVDEWYL